MQIIDEGKLLIVDEWKWKNEKQEVIPRAEKLYMYVGIWQAFLEKLFYRSGAKTHKAYSLVTTCFTWVGRGTWRKHSVSLCGAGWCGNINPQSPALEGTFELCRSSPGARGTGKHQQVQLLCFIHVSIDPVSIVSVTNFQNSPIVSMAYLPNYSLPVSCVSWALCSLQMLIGSK